MSKTKGIMDLFARLEIAVYFWKKREVDLVNTYMKGIEVIKTLDEAEELLDILKRSQSTNVMEETSSKIIIGNYLGTCPNCHKIVHNNLECGADNYCQRCGQHLHWNMIEEMKQKE